jgi:hypothetical protein
MSWDMTSRVKFCAQDVTTKFQWSKERGVWRQGVSTEYMGLWPFDTFLLSDFTSLPLTYENGAVCLVRLDLHIFKPGVSICYIGIKNSG